MSSFDVQKDSFIIPSTQEGVYKVNDDDRVFEIHHNRNTCEIHYQLYKENSKLMSFGASIVDKNTIRVTLPDDEEYELVIWS